MNKLRHSQRIVFPPHGTTSQHALGKNIYFIDCLVKKKSIRANNDLLFVSQGPQNVRIWSRIFKNSPHFLHSASEFCRKMSNIQTGMCESLRPMMAETLERIYGAG